MRIYFLALVPISMVLSGSYADGGSALYPPGLQPLISRANTLLSLGQFNDAAQAYSEAIGDCLSTFLPSFISFLTIASSDQSPADYLLYYKRATAYFSLSRHGPALEDVTKVLSLTSNTFDGAHLMSAKINARDGNWVSALQSLKSHKHAGTDEAVKALELDVEDGQKDEKQARREMGAQLWTACYESATRALRVATYSMGIREMRAECALRAGDVESAVGDMRYVAAFRLSV